MLGGLVERYMFISVERYGAQWTYDITEFPVVVIMFIITLYGIASPYISQARQKRKDIANGITTSQVATFSYNKRGFDLDFAFGAGIALMFIVELSIASTWEFGARLIPQVMGYLALIILAFFLFAKLFYQAGAKMVTTKDADGNDIVREEAESDVHFDIVVDFGDLDKSIDHPPGICLFRVVWVLLLWRPLLSASWSRCSCSSSVICGSGARRPGATTLLIACPLWAFCYGLFHHILIIPWPQSVVGDLFPVLRTINWANLF